MTELWLGYAESSGRREVLRALRRISPGSAVVFARSAQELRERFREEEPGTVGAIVGHTEDGVSDMNLAAAVASDGLASEVVLVARGVSGSLRSRASRAGITQVIDAVVAPGMAAQQAADAPVEQEAQDLLPAPVEPVSRQDVQPDAVGEVLTLGGTFAADVAATVDPQRVTVMEEPLERPDESSPILTVVSGRGGVGKTALVSLMAGVAARWGMDVAVVDLDLSCGNLHSCFGVAKGPDLERIAVQGAVSPESMGRASVRCTEHVHLWGPCERPEMAETVMPYVASLLSYLSSRFDLVLVDTSTTFTDAVAQAVQSSDRLLVVHDERPGAVSSAARMSALAVRLGVARTRIVRVINLGDPRTKPNAFEGRAEVGLETARLHRVVDGGIETEELLMAGKGEEGCATSSEVVMGVAGLLAQTLAELGKLPDNESARKASEYRSLKRRHTLFGKRREAV